MNEKPKYSYQEIGEKLLYLNGSFENDELNEIYLHSSEAAQSRLETESILRLENYPQDLDLLRRERRRRGLFIISAVVNSDCEKIVDDVLSARIIYDNEEKAVEITYK